MTLFEHPKYIPDELNASSPEEIYYAFKEGVKELIGKELPFKSLIILLSHSALETGHWKVGLHCWNFGNTKAYPDKLKGGEYFTMFRCSEILSGKEQFFDPPHPYTAFRAFLSSKDGIEHQIKFLLQKRYAKAWQEVLNGNSSAYSLALHKAGYYTASPTLYTKVLVSVVAKYSKMEKQLTSWEPPKTHPPMPADPHPDNIPIPYEPAIIKVEDEIVKPKNKMKAAGIIGIIAIIIGYIISLLGL